MPVETITLGWLKGRVLHILTNQAALGANPDLEVEVAWALHTALREFVSFTELMAFRRDAILIIGTFANEVDYQLAPDWIRMIEPGIRFSESDYRTVFYMTEQDWLHYGLDHSQETGDPTHYVLRNRRENTGDQQIRFYPRMTTPRTLTYHYLSLPLKLYDKPDATSIDIRLPPDHHHALVWGAVAQFGRYLNSSPELQIYVDKWEKAKQKAKETAPAVGQSHIRQPWTGPRGVGRGYPFSSLPIGPSA